MLERNKEQVIHNISKMSQELTFIEIMNRKCQIIKITKLMQENKQIELQCYDSQRLLHDQMKQNDQEIKPASLFSLFRFATNTDYLLMTIGTICACALGAAIPGTALLLGNMINSFAERGDAMVNDSKNAMFNFIEIGAGTVLAGWGMFGCWMITGERQGIACRKHYLQSLLKQEIGWFDTINQSELSTTFATNSFAYQQAIGEKISTLIMTFAMFIAGFIIAFTKGWLMTLVMVATLPTTALAGYLYSSAITKKDADFQKEYSNAGGQVEQAIGAIRTVKQLNGQEFQSQKYGQTLKKIVQHSAKHGLFLGIGIGSMFLFDLCSYGLGFWYGSHCVEGTSSCPSNLNGGNKYSAGDVTVIFFSIVFAAYNLIIVTPSVKKISQGRLAATRIFKIIDREPRIKSPQNGIKPTQFKGVFKFEKVTFAYPKDPSNNILDRVTLEIKARSTAFVGQSGCGKSTIFQLMMRFYDPKEGRVTLDGVDLRDLDLNWLRQQIGYVGQEPVLFATTLRENLLFGKKDATQQEIDAALKKAEAYDFVNTLKDKLQTFAGTAGSQISGGQKQRLGIARALLKNPKILLLDEATSALDRRNEKLIQETLNKIALDTTTITIAHRVKTIMKCDEIFVLEKGRILERGRFSQLQRFKDIGIDLQENQIESPLKETQKLICDTQVMAVKAEENENKQAQQQELQRKKTQEILQKYSQSTFSRLFSYCSDRKGLFVIGIIASILNGVVYPIFSVFLAKITSILLDFSSNPSQARSDANLYSLIFVILGIASLILTIIQQTIFSIVGEQLTEKIRNETYLKMLKMPIRWLDLPRNSSGALSARLASDCKTVNGLTTTYISILMQNIANLVAGIVIALVFEWRTALIAMGLIPLMILVGAIQMAFTNGFSSNTDAAYKDSSSLISESMLNIRTVASFSSQNIILDRYSQRLALPLELGVKKGNISGILYGLSQCIMFVCFAVLFYLGAIFIRDNNLQVEDVFTAIYAIMFAGMVAGNNTQFMPDIGLAKQAAANIFQILDDEDQDQLQVKQGSKLLKTPINGHIVLKNVSFKYQSRNVYVFKNLSLQIQAGWKVGFVGTSGCGKSTIFQLLQRFYDPQSGQIFIDGVNILDYDIHHLRASFGVVSQEPVLFNDSIGNNIKYNKPDVTMDEIIDAANRASFVPDADRPQQDNSLKLIGQTQEILSSNNPIVRAFSKNVGVKGSHISGGQKQRVAIARVIVRNPSLLFLDEATSALDSATEKSVQQSLDRMMEGRTCISIAHRIDTVKNSNAIMVFEKGVIVEKGTYEELIDLKGMFYKLEKGIQFV